MELLSGFGKQGVELGLLTKPVDIEDTSFLSTYFIFQEFSSELTAGKNAITFNGSDLLKKDSEVLVECLDSGGNPLYIESTTRTNTSYKESSGYVLSIHVYNETLNGPGKLVLYGTLVNGFTVKWVGNLIIDKTKQNVSSVRFYNKPTISVKSILFPVIDNTSVLTKTVNLSGSFYTYAASPNRDSINTKNIEIDYRLFCNLFNNEIPEDPYSTEHIFNSQIIGSTITLNVETIQEPYSGKNLNVSFSVPLTVKNVLTKNSIQLNDVISYKDNRGNDVVSNVINGKFNIEYNYIVYNTGSESYIIINIEDPDTKESRDVTVKSSYADISYKNLKTYSGFIARHKIYKKSLFSPADFEILSDEPLNPYELLQDTVTSNKSFSNMGYFYNQFHINQYILKTDLLSTTINSDKLNEGLDIQPVVGYTNSDLNSLNNYLIFKNNTTDPLVNVRTNEYIPYDVDQFLTNTGPSYDSNFIELKKDTNYILSVNSIIKKDATTISETDAGLEFYFTSSIEGINLQQESVHSQKGLLKLGSITSDTPINEKSFDKPTQILFSVNCDLYGTLIIVPRKCSATISQLSIKPYGDYGFSPDILITKIPFPIKVKNESFEIRSELFDIHSNLVYSDLRIVSNFDEVGESLYVYIPGLKDPSNTSVLKGSLKVNVGLEVVDNTLLDKNLTVGGTVAMTGIIESPYDIERLLSWNKTTGQVYYTNINDIENVGTEAINLKLYTKESTSTTKNTFRLIPSVEGRNVTVPRKPISLESPPTT